ncbi:alpha-D-ribose 1-methylphosphonate 5-triphosphate diphosphatase [uncultured Amaricoccus sp.]|uniref:alpha-D-ribose 1-methylphosphonate 5-triphosphate diphosphatase n=1 Tax=uncultured Amaricoccus sp. TaxID=339341 RepID=UPI002621E1D9|nr:alpha-D-ribose 1-methylphosphonate 5-triphosphate diphosphatase [uncultured Amaricoccus sp.]
MPHDGGRPQQTTLVLGNARLVLPGEVVAGALVVEDGMITAIDQGRRAPRGALDCEGDLLVPGLVELHTDNLERHLEPRPDVRWPPAAAILAHDAEFAGLGVTTVFDALRVGSIPSSRRAGTRGYARALATELGRLRAAGVLRLDHRSHLRAEICSETLISELAEFGPEDAVGLVSLMDHTPGQRQFADIEQMRRYYRGKRDFTDADFDAHVTLLHGIKARLGPAHEAAAPAAARRLGAVLASHDDTTPEHVAASAARGVRIAEFPTTLPAARACAAAGIPVMMGAPNLLRGASHSGNVAAGDLAAAGLLDILSSDYVPASLLLGAVRLGLESGDLARGFAAVTDAPARAAGLADRGRLAPGLRADLARVRLRNDLPVTRGVWVAGARVA